MMNAVKNQVRIEAQRAMSLRATTRIGIVDGYDPSHYAVKVRIQPENILTGWLPLTTPWAGNGWGMYSPPSLGDIVDVHFQQGDPNAGFVVQRFFSNTVQPLAVPSGEFWLVHKSGAFLKFTNDGKVSVTSASDLNFVSAGDINLTSAGKVNISAGTEAILHGATKAIFDAGGTGFTYQPSQIDTYTDGVTGNHHSPNPPEEPQ